MPYGKIDRRPGQIARPMPIGRNRKCKTGKTCPTFVGVYILPCKKTHTHKRTFSMLIIQKLMYLLNVCWVAMQHLRLAFTMSILVAGEEVVSKEKALSLGTVSRDFFFLFFFFLILMLAITETNCVQ